MDFNQDEKDIQQFLKKHPMKRPPESLMKNYEDEVRKKISGSHGRPFGGGLIMNLSLGFAAAGLLIFIAHSGVLNPQNQPVVIPVSSTVTMREAAAPKMAALDAKIQNQADAVSANIMDDLLVLEALGEDEGLLGDFDSVGPDIEFLPQIAL